MSAVSSTPRVLWMLAAVGTIVAASLARAPVLRWVHTRTASSGVTVTLVTAPDEATGRVLAKTLVENKVAACVNILPGVTSVYSWEGKVEEEGEVLLLIKSASGEEERQILWETVREHHPYDTPEFVQVDANFVEPTYRDWVLANTSS